MEDKKWYHRFITHKDEATSGFLIALLTAIISLPIFIVVYGYMPEIPVPFSDGARMDHFLTFVIVFVLVYILVKKLRILVYGLCILGLAVLTYTNFTNRYGLRDLYHDYATLLYGLQANNENIEFDELIDVPFHRRAALEEAVDYDHKMVIQTARNFATTNFKDYEYRNRHRKLVQFFSIFKEVYDRWDYVYDPNGEDYYSMTSETLEQLEYDDRLKGDCDDYSICMAGLIKAVGGEVRLVRTTVALSDSVEIGHLYPEVKIGTSKDLETAIYLIKADLFYKESKGESVFYYKDTDGYIWLNFDYNDLYPGGRYQSKVRESVLAL